MSKKNHPESKLQENLKTRIRAAGIPCLMGTPYCEIRKKVCLDCESQPGCEILALSMGAIVRAQAEIVHMGPQFSEIINRQTQHSIDNMIALESAKMRRIVDA